MNLMKTLRFILEHPLNRAERWRAFARFSRWQLATRLLPYPVAVPFVDDICLMAERGMTGATGNFYCGLHEPEDMAFVLHMLRSGDVFYDVGANVGTYSLLAAGAGASEVHGFEPSGATFSKYRRNIEVNDLNGTIRAHRIALGDCAGEVRFTSSLDTRNHIVAEGEEPAQQEVVPQMRLDEFYQAGRPSFVKMDVEGFEIAVLDGATNALRDPCLMGLLVEDDGYTKRYREGRRAPGVLAEFGFSAFVYDPFRRELTPRTSNAKGTNKLFLRNPEQVMKRVQTAPRFKLVNGAI